MFAPVILLVISNPVRTHTHTHLCAQDARAFYESTYRACSPARTSSLTHRSSSMVPRAAFLNVFLRDAVSCPNAASILRPVHTSMRDVTRATTPLAISNNLNAPCPPALRTRARRADNGFEQSVPHRSARQRGNHLNPKP